MSPDPSPGYAGGDTTLTVEIDVEQNYITSGGMWSLSGDTATIEYCIRVDLYADADSSGGVNTNDPTDSVSFHETIVTVTLDMTQCVGTDKGTPGSCAMAEEVDITRGAEDASNPASVNVDYDLEAYWLATSSGCIFGATPTSTALEQQDIVYICVAVNTEDVRIKEIRSLELKHGLATITAIDGSGGSPVPTEVTVVTGSGSQAVLISTRLVAKFFENDSDMVDVSGVAVLEFYDDGDRRELRVPLLRSRKTDNSSRELENAVHTQHGFQLSLPYEPSSAAPDRTTTMKAALVAAASIFLFI